MGTHWNRLTNCQGNSNEYLQHIFMENWRKLSMNYHQLSFLSVLLSTQRQKTRKSICPCKIMCHWQNTKVYNSHQNKQIRCICALKLTMSLRKRSFSSLSCSFFCSRSVFMWCINTALLILLIFDVMFRWNSLNSFACWRTAFRYSWNISYQKKTYKLGHKGDNPWA